MISALKNKTLALLRWSQKYTKVDMVYLARGGFWLGVQQFFIILTGLFVSIIMANFIPKEVFGEYKYALSFAAVLVLFSLAGNRISTIRSVAQHKRVRIEAIVKSSVSWGSIGFLVSALIGVYYYYQGNSDLGSVFLIMAVFLPFFDTFTIYDSWLRGEEKFKKVSILKSGIHIGFFLLLGTIVLLFPDITTPGLILFYFASYTLLRIIAFSATFRKFSVKRLTKLKMREDEKELTTYGKHLTLMHLSPILAASFDKLIAFQFFGSVALASYAFALIIPDQIKSAFKHVVSVALPKLSNQNIEQIKATLFKRVLALFLVSGFVIFVYISFAPLIFKTLFPAYVDAVSLTVLYAISMLPAAPIFYIKTALNAIAAVKSQYIYAFTAPLFQILFTLVGGLIFGIEGLVYGIILAQFLTLFLLISLIVFQKKSSS